MGESHVHAEDGGNHVLIQGRLVLNQTDTASSLPQCLEVHLMDLTFTVSSLTMSQLLFSPSAFYFPFTVLWIDSWVSSFLSELSVSWPFICLQIVNCNFDHGWVLFRTAALPVAWTCLWWFSASPTPPPLFFNLTSWLLHSLITCFGSSSHAKFFYFRLTCTAWI